MSIATIDGLIAGFQTPAYFDRANAGAAGTMQFKSAWGAQATGIPGAGGFDSTINGVTLSCSGAQVDGQIRRYDAGVGNNYLARFAAMSSQTGMLFLADRLWHNGGINMTSAAVQPLTSPTWPSRDANGNTDGLGVLIGVEASASVGTPQTLTLVYTNSAGTGGQSVTLGGSAAGLNSQGNMGIFPLIGGDLGVRSVQSIKAAASMVSGQINLFAFRILAALPCRSGNTGESMDAIRSGFTRLYNGTVPMMFWWANVAGGARLTGTYTEAHG